MIHFTDVYKTGHREQYPDNTQLVYTNLTPRSFKHAPTDEFVVFGIQAVILEFLIKRFNRDFFDKPKDEVVNTYKRRIQRTVGLENVTHVGELHDLGYLPLFIKALPEGTKVKAGIPVLTIVNTKPEFYWLVNYLETVLSSALWKPMTVASIAYGYRKLMQKYADLTGTEFNPFQVHDFSFRGMPGPDDAAMSGMGHLLSFAGTDTIPAIDAVEEYYDVDPDNPIGQSVPATEHSVMCMGGKETELETFERLLDKYPVGIISIVSDTWDYWKVLTEYSVKLKDKIEARQPIMDGDTMLVPGKTVFRPDSGDPVRIIAGYRPDEVTDGLTQEEIDGSVVTLYKLHGGTTNDKGFKTINPSFGLIYGDSITLARAEEILERLAEKGFASDNIVFGVGSFTYQMVTRDTYGLAMKATYGIIDGEPVEVYKDPKTDDGTKKSAKGLLVVTEDLELLDQQQSDAGGMLKPVFCDGRLLRTEKFEDIQARL